MRIGLIEILKLKIAKNVDVDTLGERAFYLLCKLVVIGRGIAVISAKIKVLIGNY